MSFNAVLWAFNQSPNKPIQKYLLLTLARRANDKNQCFPSISRLILDTGMGRRTIQEHLRELLAQGLINITERIGSSNIYTLINKSKKSAGASNEKPFSQHSRKKSAHPPCDIRIQNKSLKTSLSKKDNAKKITPPVDNLTPEMKKAYDWAKKEPFWSPKIEKIVNFIRFYTLGDLKNQYLHFLNKKQTRFTNQSRGRSSQSVRPAKKIKTKQSWERLGFQSEKDYHDDTGRKAMEKLESFASAFDSSKPSVLEIKINKLRLKQTLQRSFKA